MVNAKRQRISREDEDYDSDRLSELPSSSRTMVNAKRQRISKEDEDYDSDRLSELPSSSRTMVNAKRQRISREDEDYDSDRLSELPSSSRTMVNAKRQRISREDEDYDNDRLSELPECVLLHIMKFMNTRDVVQTCVLSKRWKDLWKRLTSFSLNKCDGRIRHYNKILSRFLLCRDDSISLLNLDFIVFRSTARSKLLKNILEHAASHNVQQLTITTDFRFSKKIPNSFAPLIFGCHSLKFLEISGSGSTLKLPQSMSLPSLKSLHLSNVSFAASDNGCTEPFSNCKSLDTLVLKHFVSHDALVLCISNSNLSTLKLVNILNWSFQPELVLSTPNLVSITIDASLISFCYQLSATCNLPFLEEVNIDGGGHADFSVIISWLQVLSNVKILTLSLKDLLNVAATKIQPPCFVRLESLIMKNVLRCKMISDDEVKKLIQYLLQNSPLTYSHVNMS